MHPDIQHYPLPASVPHHDALREWVSDAYLADKTDRTAKVTEYEQQETPAVRDPYYFFRRKYVKSYRRMLQQQEDASYTSEFIRLHFCIAIARQAAATESEALAAERAVRVREGMCFDLETFLKRSRSTLRHFGRPEFDEIIEQKYDSTNLSKMQDLLLALERIKTNLHRSRLARSLPVWRSAGFVSQLHAPEFLNCSCAYIGTTPQPAVQPAARVFDLQQAHACVRGLSYFAIDAEFTDASHREWLIGLLIRLRSEFDVCCTNTLDLAASMEALCFVLHFYLDLRAVETLDRIFAMQQSDTDTDDDRSE
jgi:hypothetical protein